MKTLLVIFLSISLSTPSIQAQIKQQVGIDLSGGAAFVTYTQRSGERKSLLGVSPSATLQYGLLWHDQFYVGLGVRMDFKLFEKGIESPVNVLSGTPFENWRITLPITVGYRSPIKKHVGFLIDVVFIPGHTVHNGYFIEYGFYGPSGRLEYYVTQPHYPLNLQLGTNFGANFKLMDRLHLQATINPKVDLLEHSSLGERFWEVAIRVGLQLTL